MAIARQAGLQRRLLLTLIDQPANTVNELAQRLDVSRPTASRVVGTLLERELVQRIFDRLNVGRQCRGAIGRCRTKVTGGIYRTGGTHLCVHRPARFQWLKMQTTAWFGSVRHVSYLSETLLVFRKDGNMVQDGEFCSSSFNI